MCLSKRKNRKTAGADHKVNELMKYGGECILTIMVMLNIWIYGEICTR